MSRNEGRRIEAVESQSSPGLRQIPFILWAILFVR